MSTLSILDKRDRVLSDNYSHTSNMLLCNAVWFTMETMATLNDTRWAETCAHKKNPAMAIPSRAENNIRLVGAVEKDTDKSNHRRRRHHHHRLRIHLHRFRDPLHSHYLIITNNVLVDTVVTQTALIWTDDWTSLLLQFDYITMTSVMWTLKTFKSPGTCLVVRQIVHNLDMSWVVAWNVMSKKYDPHCTEKQQGELPVYLPCL